MTRECDVCGEDTSTPDLVDVGDGRVCPECHGALFVDGSTDTVETESTDDRSPALDAFADAVEFFHERFDRSIDDHQSGEHADCPDTGREYNHAHKTKVTAGRTVAFDEYPDAYETLLGPELQDSVSCWLEATDGIPFDSYTDLLENRTGESRRSDALLWFEEHSIERDETQVFDDASAHTAAPLAVFTLLASDDLENGLERATLRTSTSASSTGHEVACPYSSHLPSSTRAESSRSTGRRRNACGNSLSGLG